ncbi:hypothetical protein EBR21_15230 [bacterium]|nr:hypothetical protein [bacterium]
MRIFFIISLIPLLVSCGVNSEYSSSNETGVVITKNPKGQPGGTSETRQVQFSASWLAPNGELLLELRSVSLSDSASNRDIVGTVDAGRFLVMTKGVTAKVEFAADAELLKRAKFIDFVIDTAVVRKNGKIVSTFSKPSILSLPFEYSASSNPANAITAYTQPSASKVGSQCSFNPVLSAAPGNAVASKGCGGEIENESD